MKIVIAGFLFIISSLFNLNQAQTIYKVVPGTNENEIALGIVNESDTEDVSMVSITLSNNPKGIEFCQRAVQLETLMRGEEKEALFTFDVKRVPGTIKDTLKFLITDKKGEIWSKAIILEYLLPSEFKLEQNYPNPFNPSTTIEFAVPQFGRYNLSVYNILGQLVEQLSEEEYQPGYYKINFNAGCLTSGIYLLRLSGDKVNKIKKMILLK